MEPKQPPAEPQATPPATVADVNAVAEAPKPAPTDAPAAESPAPANDQPKAMSQLPNNPGLHDHQLARSKLLLAAAGMLVLAAIALSSVMIIHGK